MYNFYDMYSPVMAADGDMYNLAMAPEVGIYSPDMGSEKHSFPYMTG